MYFMIPFFSIVDVIFCYIAASGGWQEPENPYTQKVTKKSHI